MTALDPTVCVCGLTLSDVDGPKHAYVPATAACWEAFGLLQADEYERFGYSRAHGMIVDAYMASHPGSEDRRNRQSVALHLAGLCAQLEFGFDAPRRVQLLQALSHQDYPPWNWLEPPGEGATLLDVMFPLDESELVERAWLWGQCVWSAWHSCADEIRTLVQEWSN